MRSCKLIFLAGLCGITSSGCNVFGVLGNAMGNPEVPAQYVLAKKPTAVIVKDLPDPSGRHIESEELAAEVDQELKVHDLAPMVALQKVVDLQSASSTDPMLPAKIARRAGAEQVIYIQIMKSSLDAGPVNDVLKGELAAIVSVIDTSTGETLWPSDGSAGAPISCDTPVMAVGDEVNRTSMRGGLDAELADRIVKFFYKYKPAK